MTKKETKSTEMSTVIELVNKKFEGIKAVPASEFYGRECNGIWFRGTESASIGGLPVYNDYVHAKTSGVNPKLAAFLTKHNWYGESYDAGTLMAFEGY